MVVPGRLGRLEAEVSNPPFANVSPPLRRRGRVGERLRRTRAPLRDNGRLTPPQSPALARLDQTPFQIQVTDLTHDGRNTRELRSIPVVMLTGFANEKAEQAAEEAGCDAYITKPVPVRELLRVVARFLPLP